MIEFKGEPVEIKCEIDKNDIFEGLKLSEKIPKGTFKISRITIRRIQIVLAFVLISYYGMNTFIKFSVFNIIMLAVCVILALLIIFIPDQITKNTADVLAKQIDNPTILIYENGIDFKDKAQKSSVKSDKLIVIENEQHIVFVSELDRVFCLPKKNIEGIEYSAVYDMLSRYPTYFRVK